VVFSPEDKILADNSYNKTIRSGCNGAALEAIANDSRAGAGVWR
jgi:hypothetical protein